MVNLWTSVESQMNKDLSLWIYIIATDTLKLVGKLNSIYNLRMWKMYIHPSTDSNLSLKPL